MDYTIKLIVYFCVAAVFLESLYRVWFHYVSIRSSGNSNSSFDAYWNNGGKILLINYILCLFTQYLGIKVDGENFRSLLTFLHGLDGFAALLIGFSIYYRSSLLLWISLLIITKFGLIHVMNRLILGKNENDGNFISKYIQTTKSYFHHVSSFFFIQDPIEIIITSLWRFISMSGHAMLVMRGRIDKNNLRFINLFLSYLRIFIALLIMIVCIFQKDIRMQFGRSAFGHITYMMIRFGPIWQTGGIYLIDIEKEKWLITNETDKIYHIIRCKYFLLSVELLLLLGFSLYLLYLRIIILFSDHHIIII